MTQIIQAGDIKNKDTAFCFQSLFFFMFDTTHY